MKLRTGRKTKGQGRDPRTKKLVRADQEIRIGRGPAKFRKKRTVDPWVRGRDGNVCSFFKSESSRKFLWMFVFRIFYYGVWPIKKFFFSKLEYKHRFLLWRYQSKYPVWEAPWFWFFLKVGNVPKNGNFENWDLILKFKSKRISSGIIPFLRVPWSAR